MRPYKSRNNLVTKKLQILAVRAGEYGPLNWPITACLLTWRKNKVRQHMRSSVKVYGDFASFFVCFPGGFLISKCNFKFRSGRADMLEIAFLAMNQVDHIRWFTRKFLPNKIPFTSLCARKSLGADKEVLTKIASCSVTSEASRC